MWATITVNDKSATLDLYFTCKAGATRQKKMGTGKQIFFEESKHCMQQKEYFSWIYTIKLRYV